MPYVNVKLAGAISKKQKAEIAEKITEVLEKVTGKPRQYTYVVIEEVKQEDWAIGGRLLSD
mgnify:CR=1 FL=1